MDPDADRNQRFPHHHGRSREEEPDARGNNVREGYSTLPRPVRVGIEATGSMQWLVNLMEELGIEHLVDHPAEIGAAEFRFLKSTFGAQPS